MGMFDRCAPHTAKAPASAAGAAPRCVVGEPEYDPVRGLASALRCIHADPRSLIGATPCSTR
ncbi:hypothetical protein FHU38_004678 [Saccharomonospora amisosensis]|uniref:Uncharacterized protein n=1 Tax=Saccharomonospora amisosensis TaxID=1128677 RepID=A0A7X5ZSU3_9PSEU|nr:hypothetical protein [Saccharomonospora amisosensis]